MPFSDFISRLMQSENGISIYISVDCSPRFLCRPTTLYIIARAVERNLGLSRLMQSENGIYIHNVMKFIWLTFVIYLDIDF